MGRQRKRVRELKGTGEKGEERERKNRENIFLYVHGWHHFQSSTPSISDFTCMFHYSERDQGTLGKFPYNKNDI